MGDFNLERLDWRELPIVAIANSLPVPVSFNCEIGRLMVNFISLHNLNQCNLVVNKDNKVLDLVFHNNNLIPVQTVTDPLTKIDHYHPPISMSVNFQTAKYLDKNKVRKYNFFKADYTKIRKDLESVDWVECLSPLSSVDDMVEKFYSILWMVIEKFVPLSNSNKRNYPVWYTKNLIGLIKEEDKYRQRFRRFRNPLDEIMTVILIT